ncbi:hypothetical protein LZ32DRAFT_611335 [Colletotrichum eremochloae]|nr:hypothetical protein LZ32DRAFT_611335 [Colletotrichum eremochloae]
MSEDPTLASFESEHGPSNTHRRFNLYHDEHQEVPFETGTNAWLPSSMVMGNAYHPRTTNSFSKTVQKPNHMYPRVTQQRITKNPEHQRVDTSTPPELSGLASSELRKLLLEDTEEPLMMARTVKHAMGKKIDSEASGNYNTIDANPNTRTNVPLQQETSQPHYTISEDEVGKKTGDKIAVLTSRMGATQQVKTSDDHVPAPVPKIALYASSRALEPKPANSRSFPNQPSYQPPASAPAFHIASQRRDVSSDGPSPTAQRWKQPERAYGKSEETHELENIMSNQNHYYSPADSSESTVNSSETYPTQGLASVLDTGISTTKTSETISGPDTDMSDLINGATSDPLVSEETSLIYLDVFRKMQQRIQQLEAENEKLLPTPGARVQIFHCLDDEDNEEIAYLSEPEWAINEDNIQLRSRFPIMDPEGYIEQKNISFVVYKHYDVDHQAAVIEEAKKCSRSLPNPEPAYQEILLASDGMVDAVKAFFALYPKSSQEFPKVNTYDRLQAPFIWWYHHRKSSKIGNLPSHQSELVKALVSHMEEAYAPLYDSIDEQFSRGFVSDISMEFLFRPGKVLVSVNDGVPQGYVSMSRAFAEADEEHRPNQRTSENRQDHSMLHFSRWVIPTRSIDYRGNFFRVETEIRVDFETEMENGEIKISSLGVMPLEYTSRAIQERLVRRSQTLWKCRKKRLMSYQGQDGTNTGERFMIDYDTYKSLHISSTYAKELSGAVPEPNLPKGDSEPCAPEIYLFPNQIPGFDLRRKKWVDVEVDRLRDVVWNEHAFKSLVADEDMKTLILALVTNQIDGKRGTDVIENKGNGLIMLLHGSPGTGKTFTAESVAEIAKKPLYSVTCGDIGTNPAEVEKYLESVFHLGKIWDCVVLLDEAEVFLEQRTLQDLQRNALVSVFLRALEYYDGILILTTNRVGTFDEAFKSRIQLALRYERLKDYQRKTIWKNFFERLKSIGEEDSIDFDDISLHIDELTRHPMNGRQIRNTITTARQLAKFMGKKMVFSHLQRTIAITNKFDQYLAEVREADVEEHGGRGQDGRYTDEYFARSDQIR